MLFDTWAGLGRILLVGPLAYGALMVLLRVSGKRTLTKLNAFDLVITVALGSTLATVVLSKDVALAEGVLALGVLAGLQYAITWSSVRFRRVEDAVKSEPTLLLHQGRFLDGAMTAQRVTRTELLAVLRGSNVASPEDAAAIVLETDGSFSVLKDTVPQGFGPPGAVPPGTAPDRA